MKLTVNNQAISGLHDIPDHIVREELLATSLAQAILNWNGMSITTSPGIGTNHILFKLIEASGIPFCEFRLSMFDPHEFDPIPYIGDDGTVKYANRDLRMAGGLPETGRVIVVLDEFEAASPPVKAYFDGLVMPDVLFIRVSRNG